MNSTFSIPQSGSHIFLRVLTFAAVLTLMISSVRGAQPVFGLKQPSTVENRAELSFTSSIRTEARRKELNIDQIISQTDVQAGSWESERVSGAAAKVLESIGKMLAHADQLETHDVGPFLAEDFFCEPLRPEPLHSVYSDNCLTVFSRGEARRFIGVPQSDSCRSAKIVECTFRGRAGCGGRF